ncbi:MAG: putative drug resistance transporter [Naasia sp.]|nr:putative drug resistance transporter [Naasia sp.]
MLTPLWRRAAAATVVPSVGVTVGVASSLSVLVPLTIDAYTPGLPVMADEFDAAEPIIALTLTAALVGLLVGQILTGLVSDRFGRRPPLLAGLVLFVLASAACLFAPSVLVLTIARFAQGIGAITALSAARAIGRDLLDGHALAVYYSRLTALTALGAIVGPLAAGLLIDVTDSWRPIFWLIGGGGVVALILVATALPETLPRKRLAAQGAGTAEVSPEVSRALLRQPQVAVPAVLAACATAVMITYLTGSAFVLQNGYGLSPSAFSIVAAGAAGGLMVCSQLNGRIARRWHPANVASVGLGLLLLDAVCLAVAFWAEAPVTVVVVLMPLLMSLLGFVIPNLITMAMSVDPARAGAAAALIGIAQFSIGPLTAPLVGLPLPGPVPMMAVVVVFYAGTAVTVLLLARRMLLARVPWAQLSSADVLEARTQSRPR